jgi:cytochrome P450
MRRDRRHDDNAGDSTPRPRSAVLISQRRGEAGTVRVAPQRRSGEPMVEHEPRYDIDFDTPERILDPFPLYEEIRALGRAVWNEHLRGWMVTGYDDVLALHADYGHFSSTTHQPPYDQAPTMIFTDPPEHTRLRNVAKQAFTKRTVTTMQEAVERVVDERLSSEVVTDALASGEPFDFATEVSAHIPTLVIADILGVSRADRADFRRWSMEVTQSVDYGLTVGAEERRRRGAEAAEHIYSYFRTEIAARRSEPRDDLMTDLVMANEHDQLTDAELVSTCRLLLAAGNDTTNKMISSLFMLLGQHPDERRRVLDDSALVEPAVEEALRFNGIAQATPRGVKGSVRAAGHEFVDGERVWLMKAAANRDPQQFPEPQRFDVGRDPNQHVAFGWGIHLCLGIHLARMEMQVALRRALPKMPDYQVVDYAYEPTYYVRGLEHLVLAPR